MEQKKILLVDDSNTVLMMERMLLNGSGFELFTAMNGEEAVSVALAKHPDLILMDVVMPKMNGFEACQQLRQLDETREIPIILVTTRGEYENVEQGYASGCDDYVTKPISNIELTSKIRNLLG